MCIHIILGKDENILESLWSIFGIICPTSSFSFCIDVIPFSLVEAFPYLFIFHFTSPSLSMPPPTPMVPLHLLGFCAYSIFSSHN